MCYDLMFDMMYGYDATRQPQPAARPLAFGTLVEHPRLPGRVCVIITPSYRLYNEQHDRVDIAIQPRTPGNHDSIIHRGMYAHQFTVITCTYRLVDYNDVTRTCTVHAPGTEIAGGSYCPHDTERLGEKLTALADAACNPREPADSGGLEGMPYKYLADAVTEVTGNDDFDTLARDAAFLASVSPSACEAACAFALLTSSASQVAAWPAFTAQIAAAIRAAEQGK